MYLSIVGINLFLMLSIAFYLLDYAFDTLVVWKLF